MFRTIGLLLVTPSLVTHSNVALASQSLLTSPSSFRGAGITEDVGLDSVVHDILTELHVPGLALALINGNETWAKGYGLASLPATAMTPETLFYFGSTTKSFTAAAMSLLVDDDEAFPQVQWTTPLSSLIRDDFVLSDDWATEHITIEDALSHRTGYPSHNMGIDNADPRECTRRLRHLPMSAEPRTTWQYSNYMFTAVGHAIETLTGRWIGDFFRERLWRPMGMRDTFLRREDVGGRPLAEEYWWDEDAQSYVHVPHLPNGRGRDPAGMVISNVLDYAKYLSVMMEEDPPLSPAGHAAIKAPRMLMPPGRSQFYSLGWSGGSVAGEKFWFHDGRIREHVSQMWMFPALGFGFVLAINANRYSAAELVANAVLERYLGANMEAGTAAHQESQTTTSPSCRQEFYPVIPDPALPRQLSLESYRGHYRHAGYGDLEVRLRCRPDQNQAAILSTLESDCWLQTAPSMGFDGLTFVLDLDHVSGEYWLAFAYVLEHAQPDGGQGLKPELCMRAETKMDHRGTVKQIGLDLRQESSNGPLIWFDRVE